MTRIRQGRKRRGYRYNAKRKLTNEQRADRARRRYNRRQKAKREGDPFVPLKDLIPVLCAAVSRNGIGKIAMTLGMDPSSLARMIAQIRIDRGGRVERWVDIRMSEADRILMALDLRLDDVYDPDIEALNGHIPRSYPQSKQARAAARRWLKRQIKHGAITPDTMAEYRRRRRSRKPHGA